MHPITSQSIAPQAANLPMLPVTSTPRAPPSTICQMASRSPQAPEGDQDQHGDEGPEREVHGWRGPEPGRC